MSEKKTKASGISFEALSSLDAPVSFWRGIPFGLQHVMAMFVANLAPILIIAGVAGLGDAQTGALVQSAMLIAGIGIDLIGLDHTAAVQSESTLLGLRLLMVGLPVLGLVFSILYFMKKYRLTEAETARISEALRQREGSKG